MALYFHTGALQTEDDEVIDAGPWDPSSVVDWRKSLCFTIATSMGLESMLWMLPGYILESQAEIEIRLRQIRDNVARLDDADIRSWYTAFESTVGPPRNGWMGWAGLWKDQIEGIDTGTWSVEKFQQDVELMDQMRFHGTAHFSPA